MEQLREKSTINTGKWSQRGIIMPFFSKLNLMLTYYVKCVCFIQHPGIETCEKLFSEEAKVEFKTIK